MNLSLVMFKSDGTRRDFPVTKDRIVIGRKPTCDLRIPLSAVSRQHCEIQVNGDGATVRDLGSSNGTFHNSVRIQEQALAPGDAIVVGPVTFTVVIDGEPTDIEPVHSILEERGDGSSAGQATQEGVAQSPGQSGLGQGSAEYPAQSGSEQQEDDASAELDDPLAALERMAAGEDKSESDDQGGYELADSNDSPDQQKSNSNKEIDELELLGEEDEPDEQRGKKRRKK